MPSEPKRKLAAIMFIDMVGYTALMQEDEDKARELIERHRDLMKPHVDKHDGEIIQFVGDGTFCRFNSAIEAVNAAIEIQHVFKLEDEMSLRIGIHVGDVVVKGDEVYGDGVNVASRLEPIAEPGGICISDRVYDDVKNQSGIKCVSIGKKNLKNVKRPMEVYALEGEGLSLPSFTSRLVNRKWIAYAAVITVLVIIGLKIDFGTIEVQSIEDISKLRIAVLPFTNMSSDPENEFFADGITGDIFTQISKIRSLEVISRTSIIQYKNTTKTINEIAKELGVATILEGSVQRGGNRVRINVQLIDANTDKQLWAETYDRDLDDIFAIQSDVALKIANALKATLTPADEARINEKPTENLEAYDFYLKGNVLYDDFGSNNKREVLEEAIASYEKAVTVDPYFVVAFSRLAHAHLAMYWDYWRFDHTDERLAKAKGAIDKASEINPEHFEVLLARGFYYYWGYRNYDEALKYLIPILEVQPNNADVLTAIGLVYRRKGLWNKAITSMKKAVDLDPRSYRKTRTLAETYTVNRMCEEAERYIDRSLVLNPKAVINYLIKELAVIACTGDLAESRRVLEEAMNRIDPNKLISQQGEQLIFERKFNKALDVFESDKRNWYYYKAYLHLKLGHLDEATSYYDSMRVEAEDDLTEDPKSSNTLLGLGLAYAGLGRNVEAVEKGLEAIKILPLSKDAYWGAFSLETLAEIYVNVGEYDKAIDKLELLSIIPSLINRHTLRLDPKWDPLREHPRFIKLIAS
ncbi:adenylate/guanylate cyclase domain-containing protein [Candidatus Marinimicrobia bacterium MT.SAG.3]|nr:adenylate/guanylate cyclase domain-containing protein [Candidatus Marinimicrobia bacterium MT.SAG.3]